MTARSGFSIVEIILASALFVILVTAAVAMLLSGLDAVRLGNEQSVATWFASEGLEHARALRNQAFTNLVDGTTTTAFEKYTRDVVVSTVDSATKKIVSTVVWNVSSSRNNSVVLTTYLTNWQSSLTTPTPSPTPGTCSALCVVASYTGGTCRGNVTQCNNNGETNLSGGNIFCTGGNNADTCCCSGSSITPTPIPSTCSSYCSINAYSTGTCRGNVTQCNNNGETNLSGGNILCTGGNNADTCCCAP